MTRLFKIFVPTSILALLILETAIITLSYLAALWFFLASEYDPVGFLLDDGGWWRIPSVTIVILFGLYFNDLYADVSVRSRVELLRQLCVTIGLAFIAQALTAYLRRDLPLPKWLMIEGSAIALVSLFSLRLLFSRVISSSLGVKRILFLGRSPIIFQITEHLSKHPELGFQAIGYLHEGSQPPEENQSLPCLGKAADVTAIAQKYRPTQIVVGMLERRDRMPALALLELRFSGITIREVSTLYEITFGRVCALEIRASQLIFSEDLGPREHNFRLQRIYSFILAIIGLLVSAPIMLLVVIAIKVTSPGSILFRQQRVGIHEKPFTLYKFRSMYENAEAKTGPVWATRNDPRITPLGYWLRRLRLDELPQLFNVVLGEMSLVGPRPERPEFVKTLSAKIPFYAQRHSVLPGITGWAQINYKYGDTIEDTIVKLEYDLYYIKNISLSLDTVILFHTLKTMLLFRGAQ